MDAKVTSIKTLKEYAKGQLVELPPFGENQPFVVRLRRPSMLVLAKQGKIPNALLNTANKLFLDKRKLDDEKQELMPEMFDVIDVIIEAALVEPTFAQIKEAGVEITDDQMLAIFNYTQMGVKALERFHTESAVNVGSGNEQEV